VIAPEVLFGVNRKHFEPDGVSDKGVGTDVIHKPHPRLPSILGGIIVNPTSPPKFDGLTHYKLGVVLRHWGVVCGGDGEEVLELLQEKLWAVIVHEHPEFQVLIV